LGVECGWSWQQQSGAERNESAAMMMTTRRSRGMESSAGAMGSNRWNVLGVCMLVVVSFWSFAHGATDQADGK
jgi:hypothetical protein